MVLTSDCLVSMSMVQSATCPPPLVSSRCLRSQVMSTSVGFVKVDVYKPDSVGAVEGRLVQLLPDSSGTPRTHDSSAAEAPSDRPPPPPPPAAPGGKQLLCNLRSILKKLGKRVLVGDHVALGAVDWDRGRATVEDVLSRHSELVDPSIANVDHALLVFALADPPVCVIIESRLPAFRISPPQPPR